MMRYLIDGYILTKPYDNEKLIIATIDFDFINTTSKMT